jgi:hypothetical protein
MEGRGLPTCRCGRVDWFNDGLVIVLDELRRTVIERVEDPDGFVSSDQWSCMHCASEVVRGSSLHRELDAFAADADADRQSRLAMVS